MNCIFVVLYSDISLNLIPFSNLKSNMNAMKAVLSAIFLSFILTKSKTLEWHPDCDGDKVLNNTCYKVFDRHLNFSAAEDECAANGGMLAIVKTQEVNRKIASLAKNFFFIFEDVWIGLNDKGPEQEYKYSDKTSMTIDDYKPWANGEPSDLYRVDHDPYQDCISMNTFTFKWYDNECSDEKSFICQFTGPQTTCDIKELSIENSETPCHIYSVFTVWNKISIKCQDNYVLHGPSDVICLPDNKWSELPKCLKSCPSHPSIPNANLIIKTEVNLVGDTAFYICKENYVSKTNPSITHFNITCSAKGTWIPINSGCYQAKNFNIKGIEILYNDSIILPCHIDEMEKYADDADKSASAITSGSYIWLKDSEILSKNLFNYTISSNGDLILSYSSLENITGYYICFLKKKKILPGNTVYDVKQKDFIQCENNPIENQYIYSYKEGDSAILSCPHTSFYVGFHWFKDNEYFAINSNHILYPDGSLYIQQLDHSYQGIYTCMMTKKDSFCSKNITVKVVVKASAESICGHLNMATDHPWTVSLWWKDELAPFCYGVLIHERWVLTTAHCLSGLYRKRKLNIFVRFGKNPIKETSSGENTDISIIAVKIHPLYLMKRNINDIGLVKLQKPVEFSYNIQPICITKTDITAKDMCGTSPTISGLVSGWESLERDEVEDISLTEESMIFVPKDKCSSAETYYTEKLLCFMKANGTEATYSGGSGSPLEIIWEDRVYVMGIYSWGERFARLGEYDFFTKVSTYVPWIASYLEDE